MVSGSGSRSLEQKELDKLLQSQPSTLVKWPSEENLRKLAKAVEDHNTLVTFTNGTRFSITYRAKYNAVFIKPANGDYIPCGYFSLDKLRGLVT